jgi:superfamily II DNA or RNA helicase/SOS-response transcriptional repressor LexA
VAFIRSTGLNLIYQALLEALKRESPVSLRLITGDYLEITEPQALRQLMLLQESGAQIKVYESGEKNSFHMKAYIFISSVDEGGDHGCAFVGSSNISKMALTEGLEWNLRVDKVENPGRFTEISEKFEHLYSNPNSIALSHDWIDTYQLRYERSQFTNKPEPIDPPELPPEPNNVQLEALDALHGTRDAGYRRALVVLATGMGKTWLSAFDARAINAKHILFVAHREEILEQAERTFVRMFPDSKVGRYTGQLRELDVDMLFASVQTLGKQKHLEKFNTGYFDYIVIDEFHHAAARTYQQLLSYFHPRFLIGLTATPERTDQSDILHLCDDNLVFRRDLVDGINTKILCPFHYYGIGDKHVDYQEVPWRNHKFDHDALVNQLATQARARHILGKWRELHQSRTLAFCVSRKHADFMADYFNRHKVSAVSVHSESDVRRNDALEQLTRGEVSVVFSVDLFNEGVDVPAIDTVLLLRPTESKILFQQQLGRGLRFSPETDKSHVVIIDFIGNHISFFRKPEALFQILAHNDARRDFIDQIESGDLMLPKGCFVNYDIEAIDFMRALISTRIDTQLEIYRGLKESLDRRPTLSEFYMGGGAVTTIRNEHAQWFALILSEGDLEPIEQEVFGLYKDFFREVEVTQMTKSFKMILLQAFLDLDGLAKKIELSELAVASFDVLQRKRQLITEVPEQFQNTPSLDKQLLNKWHTYWKRNPVAAWIGGNRSNLQPFFIQQKEEFGFNDNVIPTHVETMTSLTQELINYRILQYEARGDVTASNVIELKRDEEEKQNIPYFTDLKIACGYFRTSEHSSENIDYIPLPVSYGNLDPAKHFIACASGDSMQGGKNPIKDGDYLLLELVSSVSAGSISNLTMAIERQDATGDDQYLLRDVKKRPDGGYDLIARNPDYPIFQADDGMRTFARLKMVIDPLVLALHDSFMREHVPPLFGYEFNVGAWQSGHVTIKDSNNQFLFVTLNKQGKQKQHQYHDYFIDKDHFHWQSQNSTDPKSGKGKGIIEHEQNGSHVYLFVRKNKLEGKTAAPFIYCGTLNHESYTGSKPMSVIWRLDDPLTVEIFDYFKL